MLEAGGLDAIAVAVPPHLQAEILIVALELGLAVFAEKPLAINLKGADRILLAQKLFAAKGAVDFYFTGVKAFAIAREKLRLGVIGPLLSDVSVCETNRGRLPQVLYEQKGQLGKLS